jgi:hypothetical protein
MLPVLNGIRPKADLMCDPPDHEPRCLPPRPNLPSPWWPGRSRRLARRTQIVEQLDLWGDPEFIVERPGDDHWIEVLLRREPCA